MRAGACACSTFLRAESPAGRSAHSGPLHDAGATRFFEPSTLPPCLAPWVAGRGKRSGEPAPSHGGKVDSLPAPDVEGPGRVPDSTRRKSINPPQGHSVLKS